MIWTEDLESEQKVFFSLRMEDILFPSGEDRLYIHSLIKVEEKDIFPNLYKLTCLLLVVLVTPAVAERKSKTFL
jgi:hypothetical protein